MSQVLPAARNCVWLADVRVLHILDHSLPRQSAYSAQSQAILMAQRDGGLETFQLTGPRHGTSQGREETIDGWEFFRTPPAGGLLAGLPVLNELEEMGDLTYRIEQLVKRLRPHILHAHSPASNALAALRVGRRVGIPVVYDVRFLWRAATVRHGPVRANSIRSSLIRAMEGWVMRHVQAVVTTTDALAAEVLGRAVRPEKTILIADGAYEPLYVRLAEARRK
jgi:glycosyltransferase involved in cell wall biosynthesis